MGKISLLDCTLRDGGYVNNWQFGFDNIKGILNGLAASDVGFLEIGFLRDETYQSDRSVFSRSEEIRRAIDGVNGVKFAAMIEAKEDVTKHFPLEKVALLKESGLDLIRIMAWEWKLEEHLEYCKKVKDFGLDISIQPTSVVDYTDDRFIELLEMTNEIKPFSLYIVDTWGTEMPHKIRHLVELADRILSPDIALGYHGHNNKMQGLACLETILEMNLSRDVLCDVSIGGMGKGPGNLQTEVVADLLNEEYNGKYDVDRLCDLYAKNVRVFFQDSPWGYSLYHFIGSKNLVTQNFATYFRNMGYGEDVFYQFVKSLKGREKVVFNKDFTENRLKELGLK